MRKYKSITIKSSLLFILCLLVTSCFDPIYEAIREDVEPEEATVSGNITTITRYTASDQEFLVLAADDGLRYKHKDLNYHGEWNTYPLPFDLHHYDFDSSSHSGEQILAVLADSSLLYLLTAEFDHTSVEGTSYPSTIKLYAKNITANGTTWNTDGDWTSVPTKAGDYDIFPVYVDSKSEYFLSGFRVFQTNTPKKEHRAVFIRSYDLDTETYKYFQLNGTSAPVEFSLPAESIIDPEPSTDEDYIPLALSAVYFNGAYKFFTSPASTTNETYTSDATYYYYTNGDSDIYYSDGNTAINALDANKVISTLAVTADSMLIGHGKTNSTAGGINRVLLTDGVPASALASFADINSNAQFQITSDYFVTALINASPEKREVESGLYAAITFSGVAYNFGNIGLWSYYPERGDWNRE